jgi:FAD synthetase
MTRVLATGTFDILHPGHLRYLEEAKKLGDELWVIVARESNIKHKPKPIMPEKHRLKMISALKIVDRAILGSKKDMFEPLRKIKPDIITVGADQHFDVGELEAELKKRGINAKVVRIKGYDPDPLCSSGKIIKRVAERYDTKFKETKKRWRLWNLKP